MQPLKSILKRAFICGVAKTSSAISIKPQRVFLVKLLAPASVRPLEIIWMQNREIKMFKTLPPPATTHAPPISTTSIPVLVRELP